VFSHLLGFRRPAIINNGEGVEIVMKSDIANIELE
jgi:hypothetical protein